MKLAMKLRSLVLIALVGAAAGITVEVTRAALADGAPTQQPLVYSGQITEGASPVTGERPINVFLWDHATSNEASHRRCATIPAAPVAVKDGRFSIPLDPTCRPIVESTAELWVEVLVAGTSMGRTKIGAVPYALEAQTAVAVTRPVYTNPTTRKQWSLNASYCGFSPSTTGAFRAGTLTGWKAAKALCESACNGSPSAHMCTGEELVRQVSTGGDIPTVPTTYGWYSSGVYRQYNGGTEVNGFECKGFTQAPDHADLGSAWNTAEEWPSIGWCSDSYAILCCD